MNDEGGATDEADVSTEREKTQKGAWIPQADENEKRPQSFGRTPPQRQKSDQCVMLGPRTVVFFYVAAAGEPVRCAARRP